MLKHALALLLMIAVIGVFPALADLQPVGDPITIGSWSQNWNLTGYTFDKIAVLMVTPGATFEAPGLTNFSDPSWSGHIVVADVKAVAAGNQILASSPTGLGFATHFNGSDTSNLAFDITFWNGSSAVFSTEAIWTYTPEHGLVPGSGAWTFAPSGPVGVPESNTADLRLSWVAGLGLLILRRRKATA
jgi:hypothetical protein